LCSASIPTESLYPLHSTPLHSTPLHSTPLHSTPLLFCLRFCCGRRCSAEAAIQILVAIVVVFVVVVIVVEVVVVVNVAETASKLTQPYSSAARADLPRLHYFLLLLFLLLLRLWRFFSLSAALHDSLWCLHSCQSLESRTTHNSKAAVILRVPFPPCYGWGCRCRCIAAAARSVLSLLLLLSMMVSISGWLPTVVGCALR
jgi:hypothetical protein